MSFTLVPSIGVLSNHRAQESPELISSEISSESLSLSKNVHFKHFKHLRIREIVKNVSVLSSSTILGSIASKKFTLRVQIRSLKILLTYMYILTRIFKRGPFGTPPFITMAPPNASFIFKMLSLVGKCMLQALFWYLTWVIWSNNEAVGRPEAPRVR